MRPKVRKDLLHDFLQSGFANDEELYFYIKEYLGHHIPTESFCPEHQSPFQFLADVYFERVTFALAFGSRSSGKTTDVAILNHLDTVFKGKEIEICSAGSTLDQAQKGYRYYQQTFKDPLLSSLLKNSIQSHSETYNGSVLEVVAGTSKGMNGPHPMKVRIDEVELMEWSILQEGLSMSISKGAVKAQDVLSSSRKVSRGVMQRLLSEADQTGLKVYNFCVGGETVIHSPEGDTRIRDLVGKEVYVYSVKDERLVLRKAKNIRKTRTHEKVYRVEYSWWSGKGGRKTQHIVATGDHKFMLRDGTYKETKDLVVEDPLMPFHKGIMLQGEGSSKKEVSLIGFTGSQIVREPTFVQEQLYGPIAKDEVMHHVDGNRLNNHPSNLEVKKRKEHSREHTISWFTEVSEEDIERRNKKISDRAKIFNTSEKSIRANRIRWDRVRENHTVTSVQSWGYQDVYCMEVEETQNFAANNVFIHNCAWDIIEQCTRQCHDDPVYGNCPIFDKCEGKAHYGKGWYKIDDLIRKVLNLSKTTFTAQWENKKPSDASTVYGEYWDDQVHVLDWDGSYGGRTLKSVFGVTSIPNEWKKIGGIDFGSIFVYLQIAIEPTKDIWIVYYEYYHDTDRLLETHAKNIKLAPDWQRRIQIYADPAGKQDRIELESYGIRTVTALKDVDLGVDAVKQRLQVNLVTRLPKLFIMRNCKNTIREFDAWAHIMHKDGTVDRESYEDFDDHCMDTVRYAVFSHRRVKRTSIRAATIDGI